MSSAPIAANPLTRLAVLAVALLSLTGVVRGHEVPNEVTVLGFVRPQGDTLTLLIRAPLKSMRDVDVPTLPNGFLDFSRSDPALRHAAQVWIADFIEIYEDGRRLSQPRLADTRVSLPSDRSFESYEQALGHLTSGARLGPETEIYWEQGMLDVALAYPIASDQSDFAIRPGLTALGLQVNVILRFLQPGSPERAFDVHADTGIVHLDPRWHQAFWLFVKEGFWHILDGTDHLLFLLCLVIPFRRFRPLLVVVTAFTVAHSATLVASAYDLAPGALWFPPLVETLIAASIFYMAIENIIGTRVERRWLMTFVFGLVHGFGFSFLLRERLQFAGSHLLSSLLAFNVGVEIGQVLVLLVLIPALGLLFTKIVDERMGTILLSAVVAHTAWHWTTERFEALRRFPFPTLDAAALASLMRWLMAAIVIGVLLWFVSGRVRKWEGLSPEGSWETQK